MSPAEIAWRTRSACRKRIWKQRIAANRFPIATRTPPTVSSADPWLSGPHRGQALPAADALLREANAALEHRWRFFDLDGVHEHPVDWHCDPKSGITAPRTFGFDINHRDESSVGDIKITWEKSRHHHLTQLAAAFALTHDNRYADEAVAQLLDWVAQNPFMIGVNWTHPLESGIRLIAWVWCERLLRGAARYADAFGPTSPLWSSVEGHLRFIEAFYSRHSSANNHLIGEIAGLFVATCAWPWLPHAARRRLTAQRMLEHEIVRQTYPSGLNRELATGYQWFVAEFFMLARLEADHAGCPFSKKYDALLRGMLEVMLHFADQNAHFPAFGDDDDGRAILLDSRNTPRWQWLFAAARQVLDAKVPDPTMPPLTMHFLGISDLKARNSTPAQASSRLGAKRRRAAALHNVSGMSNECGNAAFGLRWLDTALKRAGLTARNAIPNQESILGTPQSLTPTSTTGGFADFEAGRFAMRLRDRESREVLVCVDAGPLGFLSIAAHAHADALSFTLNYDGQPVLVDPGTYVYHTKPHWRRYFRGTAAHNTLRVNASDQSVQVGAFAWASKARGRILTWEAEDRNFLLEAEHNGYLKRFGVTHRRRFKLDPQALRIEDCVAGNTVADIEWRLHLHPDWDIALEGKTAILSMIASDNDPKRQLVLTLSSELDWRVEMGSDDAGWDSPRFGLKVPTRTVIGQAQRQLPLVMKHRIAW